MDSVKKAAVVVNEYLMDFLDTISQFPTKDIDAIRQVAGHWPLVKQLIKTLTIDIQKDKELDPQYVKAVLEDFKSAATLLDKLESYYKNLLTFDLEGIKTHTEPLLKLIERAKGSDVEMTPEEPMPEEEALPTEDKVEKMARIAAELDRIANEVESQEAMVALALDKISDQLYKF